MNVQLVEKQVTREDGALDVVEVFATIQGEGPFVGRPAVFVRLAGCNLQCQLCDTDYTSKRQLVSPLSLILRVNGEMRGKFWGPGQRLCYHRGFIVLTGGEPFRQPCGPFIEKALANYDVQVETNGTLWEPSIDPNRIQLWRKGGLSIVCSPKTAKLNPQLEPHIDAYKYVVKAGEIDSFDGLPTSSLLEGVRPARPHKDFQGEIFVQPCDEQDPEKNAANTKAAAESCMKLGYRLTVQVHKIVGLP